MKILLWISNWFKVLFASQVQTGGSGSINIQAGGNCDLLGFYCIQCDKLFMHQGKPKGGTRDKPLCKSCYNKLLYIGE